MRKIEVTELTNKIKQALLEINYQLPSDISKALQAASQTEKNPIAQATLAKILENAECAKQEQIPICQDTGLVTIFAEIGQEVHFTGGDFNAALQQGIRAAYPLLRKSVVKDPLERVNTKDNTPGIIYTTLVPGENVIFKILAKGGGAENKSALKMFEPTASTAEIFNFVLETVKKADASACPPLIVGIGLGGTFDYCPQLAKKALCRSIGTPNQSEYYQKMEMELLNKINQLNIGPEGFGGQTTALAVHIETQPCHIASLPVAVNIQCHAARHVTLQI